MIIDSIDLERVRLGEWRETSLAELKHKIERVCATHAIYLEELRKNDEPEAQRALSHLLVDLASELDEGD